MERPYIGITGFMSKEEANAIFELQQLPKNRLVMVGVLASLKTLRGIQNKRPNRYPKVENIAEIFPEHPQALNLIHYATDEPETLYTQLREITKLGGENMHGLQLNIAWPPPFALYEYRLAYPFKKIVLQIGNRALEMVDTLPLFLAEKIRSYEKVVDYILIDPSGGLGKPLDTSHADVYLRVLKRKNIDIGLGVAGGLSPTTLNLVEPLAEDFPDLSIDAEGRLRDENDNLDLVLAKKYLEKAFEIFRK